MRCSYSTRFILFLGAFPMGGGGAALRRSSAGRRRLPPRLRPPEERAARPRPRRMEGRGRRRSTSRKTRPGRSSRSRPSVAQIEATIPCRTSGSVRVLRSGGAHRLPPGGRLQRWIPRGRPPPGAAGAACLPGVGERVEPARIADRRREHLRSSAPGAPRAQQHLPAEHRARRRDRARRRAPRRPRAPGPERTRNQPAAVALLARSSGNGAPGAVRLAAREHLVETRATGAPRRAGHAARAYSRGPRSRPPIHASALGVVAVPSEPLGPERVRHAGAADLGEAALGERERRESDAPERDPEPGCRGGARA